MLVTREETKVFIRREQSESKQGNDCAQIKRRKSSQPNQCDTKQVFWCNRAAVTDTDCMDQGRDENKFRKTSSNIRKNDKYYDALLPTVRQTLEQF